MDQRLNLGNEVRELKLGSTFNTPKPRTSFHTLKYDFKPASVDITKPATLDVSSNNQVTVTMPHLDSSGVPKTVFKGNQRNYTKECVLIIDKATGEITLEKLHHNIQVKKTRSETNHRPTAFSSQQSASSGASGSSAALRPYLENSTQRVSNKTRVSTGIRKNAIGGFVQRHSPIQGSPSYPHHRSPQQAPAWNANNGQSTLPSIPMIGMDEDFLPTPNTIAATNFAAAVPSTTATISTEIPYQSSYHSFKQSRSSPKLNVSSNHQPMHSSHISSSNHNSLNNNLINIQPQPSNHRRQDDISEIGVLTSSDSSDSSDSDNDSDSDSNDDDDDDKNEDRKIIDDRKAGTTSSISHLQNSSHLNHHSNSLNNRTESLPALLLDEDLRLSESNSSDSDD